YAYKKLDQFTRQIRLLRIDPAADRPTARRLGHLWDLPSCHIETFDLGSQPHYLALSYAWGDESFGKSGILLDGQSFEVTSSLYTYLELFRSDPYSKTVPYIWIDQICINQSDVDERSYVVRFMWSIYQKAAHVVVWLGDSEETEAAAKANRYFERLWIVQELLLARSVVINCRETWGMHLSTLQEHVQKRQATIHPRIKNPSLFLLWDSIHNRKGRHLEQCIERYCRNDCQDPRDKVYALLGIVKEEEQVPIDYSKSISEVYIDTIQVLARRWWLQ
ncbi:hypothetical protein EK21DRAFT_10728, partial [Setomelanomma holmii]